MSALGFTMVTVQVVFRLISGLWCLILHKN